MQVSLAHQTIAWLILNDNSHLIKSCSDLLYFVRQALLKPFSVKVILIEHLKLSQGGLILELNWQDHRGALAPLFHVKFSTLRTYCKLVWIVYSLTHSLILIKHFILILQFSWNPFNYSVWQITPTHIHSPYTYTHIAALTPLTFLLLFWQCMFTVKSCLPCWCS